ncbi:MAG TPA: LLM class flavin-dependent oxidoreductase [Stellaceae bacterium]|nr:LLM class flavin-dependent oxidoreductase [Stellaceae bacterium]
MKFAHFAHVWGKEGMTPAERYQQLWRELVLCDELGFDYGFCVEHHFRPDESWMSAPGLYAVGGGARTKRIRLGGMGHIVPLHNPIRLVEEIAVADQMLEGRLEVGLVPGINPDYFRPFDVPFDNRREVTQEFVGFLKTAYAAKDFFDFDGAFHHVKHTRLAVPPMQRPHPPLWIETRDPASLAFCAKEGINAGYFFLYPREHAAPRYRKFLEQWREAGWKHKPHVAYSCVCYVDETDAKALQRLKEAGAAYRGFLPAVKSEAELAAVTEENAKRFEARGEPGAAEVARHLLDGAWQLERNLILIGSPDTVARKLKQCATEGLFDTFFGEFNFGNLPEEDLMRSIRLFGTEVMPRLRAFEPY